MYYYLSKIAVFLLSPLVWSLIVVSVGLLLGGKGKINWIYLGCVLIIIFSNKLIYQKAIILWESDTKHFLSCSNMPVVVLGGITYWDNEQLITEFTDAGDRYVQALNMYQSGVVKKIVFSGGSRSVAIEYSEANFLKDLAISHGIPDTVIYVENKSLNTYENAYFSDELFEQCGFPRDIVLVTSAYHMSRAKRCFEKQQFNVIPYAVHSIKYAEPFSFSDYLIPNISVLYRWPLLFKEWIGILVYKTLGYC